MDSPFDRNRRYLVAFVGGMVAVPRAMAQTELVGAKWWLTSASGAPSVGEAWLTFAADGAVSGNTGCNSLRGTAEIGDGTINFGPLATTRMACRDEGAMEQEASVLSILSGETVYGIEGEVLTIARPDDGVALTFERRGG